jgi:hypothetical protein
MTEGPIRAPMTAARTTPAAPATGDERDGREAPIFVVVDANASHCGQ